MYSNLFRLFLLVSILCVYLINLSGQCSDLEDEVWDQIGQDIDGVSAGEQLGRSVSLSSDGTILATGSIYSNGVYDSSGFVRVYQSLDGNWTQLGNDIEGEAYDDRSGTAVVLSSDGKVVAIGATRNDGNGQSSGHVRIYEYVSDN